MNTSKPSKKKVVLGSFNGKNIEGLTVKQIREMYKEAKAFVKICDETFSEIVGVPSITSGRNAQGSILPGEISPYDSSFGGPVGNLGGYVHVGEEGNVFQQEFTNYDSPEFYTPPVEARPIIPTQPIGVSRNMSSERTLDNVEPTFDSDDEVSGILDEELTKLTELLFNRQQQEKLESE